MTRREQLEDLAFAPRELVELRLVGQLWRRLLSPALDHPPGPFVGGLRG